MVGYGYGGLFKIQIQETLMENSRLFSTISTFFSSFVSLGALLEAPHRTEAKLPNFLYGGGSNSSKFSEFRTI